MTPDATLAEEKPDATLTDMTERDVDQRADRRWRMRDDSSCCSPSRGEGIRVDRPNPEGVSAADVDTTRMVRLDGGQFRMGTDSEVGFPEDGEGPARDVTVDPFYVAWHALTNAEFLSFVRDTGYTTDAGRYG